MRPCGRIAVLTADPAIELAAERGFEELDDLLGPSSPSPAGRSCRPTLGTTAVRRVASVLLLG